MSGWSENRHTNANTSTRVVRNIDRKTTSKAEKVYEFCGFGVAAAWNDDD